MEKIVIALDLGTTGNRAIAFGMEGRVVADSYMEFPLIFPEPSWVEQDPYDILNCALDVLQETVAKCENYEITSIGITNQRETTILWNKVSGEPVYNAIVWQCGRTAGTCRDLSSLGNLVKGKTGLFIDPYFSATKIKWILENVAGVRELAGAGKIAFGTVDSWILWNLTGGKKHLSDPSNASRTLLYNIHDLDYDPELLEIFNVPADILPEVKDSDSIFGYTDKNILGKSIPIVGILGDQQASLFAHGGMEEGIIKNTYGTGLFAMVETGGSIYDSSGLVSTVAWKIGGKVFYALEGSIFSGGSVIKYLKDALGIIGDVSDSSIIAGELDSNGGVYFVPALNGLGAPYWDHSARGMIIGLTGASTGKHVIRAALESLAYRTRDVLMEFESTLGINFKASGYKLRVDGKVSRNEFLMQFQSDILNMEVEKTAITEMTAFGIAGLSAVTTGLWTYPSFSGFKKIEKNYLPHINEKEREFLYGKWKNAVSRSVGWEY